MPAAGEIGPIMARTSAVIAAHPEIPVTQVTLNLTGPAVTVEAGAGGPPGSPMLKIDAASGKLIPQPPVEPDFHNVLQDIHAGYIAGWTGRIISVLCGISLIVLSITGLEMWWTMRKRGKKKGLW